jgi:hypothetical protein
LLEVRYRYFSIVNKYREWIPYMAFGIIHMQPEVRSNPGKQERAAWLSESDVDFFTGGAPPGESSGNSEAVDPAMQQVVQASGCVRV